MMGFNHIVLMLISLSVVSFSQINNEQVYSVDTELGFSTGPDVGQTVPIFSLPDQNGTTMSLKELVGENGAILNFFRSASW
jgi:hypothetical protein